MNISPNQPAPNFQLPDQEGQLHSLSDYLGKWVLLYFYPKDDTPGCTREACELRDAWSEFQEVNAVVLGVSADSVESHQKFVTKHQLPFTVLSDPEKQVIKEYGAWGEKKMFNNTFLGIQRSSVLIDPEGKVAKIYEKVKPAEHAKQVLKDLRKLKQ